MVKIGDMLPDYDFSKVVRDKYAGRYAQRLEQLAYDVARACLRGVSA